VEVILIHVFAAVVAPAVVAVHRVLARLLDLLIVSLLMLSPKLLLYVPFPASSVVVVLAGPWTVEFINILQVLLL
jgi:hypothetical protein